MLNFYRENVLVESAPGFAQEVIGVGSADAIALSITNKGSSSLDKLELQYGGGNNIWWELAANAADFDASGTMIQGMDGSDPTKLAPNESATVYINTTDISSLLVKAVAAGERDVYPEPSTYLDISAIEIKLGSYGLATRNKSMIAESKLITYTTGYIQAGAKSFSIENSGEGVAYVYFPREDKTWGMGIIPPGSTRTWTDSKYGEIRIDASLTSVDVVATGAVAVVGNWDTGVDISLGIVSPKTVKKGQTMTVKWDLAGFPPGDYTIGIYPSSATFYREYLSADPTAVIQANTALTTNGSGTITIPNTPAFADGNFKLAAVLNFSDGNFMAIIPFKIVS
jgi:hypothetical protein